MFVTSAVFYFNGPLQNTPCCFHNDWNSARIGSIRNQQQQLQQMDINYSLLKTGNKTANINVKKLQFIHSVNGDGSKTAKKS